MLSQTELDPRIDAAVGLILATCPNKETRDSLFKEYLDESKSKGKLTGAAFAFGSLLSYLSSTMDLVTMTEEDKQYGGKPQVYYLLEVDYLIGRYKSDVVAQLLNPDHRVEASTALIISYYPTRVDRERLWQEYVQKRDSTDLLNASILAMASLFNSMAPEFGLTEEAYGSF